MEKSWVLQAIEREAMSRAAASMGPVAMVAGCTMKQILWLICDYKNRTGKLAANIDPKAELDS